MKMGMTTFGCDHGRSGIGRYLTRHLAEFQKLGLRPRIYGSTNDRHLLSALGKDFAGLVSSKWDSPIRSILLHQTWLPRQTRELDVLFLPAANRRLPFYSSCPTVGTVHDLAVAKLDGKYDRARTIYVSKILPQLIKRLDHILTVSEASKQDIIEITGVSEERVSVVPLGVDHTRYYPQCPTVDLANYGVEKPFLLYVSRIEHPGKNHQRLLLAFEELKKKLGIPHQLVLVGSDWKGAEHVHAFADKLSSRKDIIFTGFFPEEHLPQLYSQAEALVFPSLYEGFGLPVLEAMACGLPVVCSNRASLPEVAGGAALLFDPQAPRELEDKLTLLLTSPNVRAACSRAGRERSLSYQWSTTALATLQVLRCVAEGRRVPKFVKQRMDGELLCG